MGRILMLALLAVALHAQGPFPWAVEKDAHLSDGDTLENFVGICSGPTVADNGFDGAQWAGLCRLEVIAGDHLRITANIGGPIQETYFSRQEVEVRFWDIPRFSPLVHVRIVGWLCFTIIPTSPNVLREIVRVVNAAAQGQGSITLTVKDAIVASTPADDDTPDSHRIVVQIKGAGLWLPVR